jgi:hypothetical protein
MRRRLHTCMRRRIHTCGAFEGNNIFLRERMLTTAGHIYCSRDTFIANHLQVQNVPYRY